MTLPSSAQMRLLERIAKNGTASRQDIDKAFLGRTFAVCMDSGWIERCGEVDESLQLTISGERALERLRRRTQS